ncbi:MAG: hydrogenase iron-sulfur subunit [Deltaproteobacteria bacterium]|nr:hydrogenase iron-sulfur subunit [Deltaproteobacteria bacterium]
MDFEPKILGIACNWCTYTGADLAGTTRLKYPQNVRTVRVMCSSRINPSFIIRAFQLGADGVLVGGCHPGDCHYGTGNLYARRKLAITKKILEFAGMDQKRFRVEWISASEGNKYAEIVEEFTRDLKALGPQNTFRIEKDSRERI